MNAYLNGMRRYVDFSGRSTRSQYWWFSLVLFILVTLALVLDGALGTGNGVNEGIIAGIIAIAHFIPQLAVSVRRLHDIDRSGWWLLIALVPLVGLVVLLVFACTASTPGANRFGAPSGGKNVPGTVQPPIVGRDASGGASIDQLEKLAKLRAEGVIEEHEYARMKSDVLGQKS